MGNIKDNNPLVSIIVITYNSSKFVLDTLESAKNQSYKNIELIVTDDCSLDNTVEICRLWMEQNKNRFVNAVLLTTENNTGIAGNCNRALKVSKGKWVKLIAGDDVLLTNCIKDNLRYAEQNSRAKFITSKLQAINEIGERIDEEPQNYEGYRKHYYQLSAAKQLKAYSRWPVFLSSPAFFVESEILEEIDYFDEDYRIFDDICLICRINGIGEKVFYFNEHTVNYRIHENSISRSTNNQISEKRKDEQYSIFNKYRKKHLNRLNLIDLSIYYENWLNFKFKGFFGFKGRSVLLKLSLFQWYLKYLDLTTK